MTSGITALDHGNWNSVTPVDDDGDVKAENERLKAQLRRLRKYVSELERTADTDPLIPVYNRRAFMRELSRAQSVSDRYDIPSCVVFLDLDQFKSINDRYGHAIGDEMLHRVGQVLMGAVRECDMVARLGGDEFGILLFKTRPDIARTKAFVLASRISEIRINMPTGEVSTSATWGISPCNERETAEQILSRADRDMYSAKNRPQVD